MLGEFAPTTSLTREKNPEGHRFESRADHHLKRHLVADAFFVVLFSPLPSVKCSGFYPYGSQSAFGCAQKRPISGLFLYLQISQDPKLKELLLFVFIQSSPLNSGKKFIICIFFQIVIYKAGMLFNS